MSNKERKVIRKKSVSIKAQKLSVPENYVQDKIKMSHSTLERMGKSQFLYNHLLDLVEKQVKASKVVYEIGSQISSTLYKIGELYPGDLGVVLADISAHTCEIDRSIKSWSESLHNDFYLPVSASMENYLKEIQEKQKSTKAIGLILNKEMTLAEKSLKKIAKGGQLQLIEEMKNFNHKRDEIDKKKADILYDVLFFERAKFRFLIGNFLKPLQAQVLLGQNMNLVCSDISRWAALCEDEKALSEEQAEALVTASEQTFKQLINPGTSPSIPPHPEDTKAKDANLVVLYKSTSLGLKNLDDTPITTDEPPLSSRRHIRASKYEPTSKSRSASYHSLDRGTLHALISPRPTSKPVDTVEDQENILHPKLKDPISPTQPTPKANKDKETRKSLLRRSSSVSNRKPGSKDYSSAPVIPSLVTSPPLPPPLRSARTVGIKSATFSIDNLPPVPPPPSPPPPTQFPPPPHPPPSTSSEPTLLSLPLPLPNPPAPPISSPLSEPSTPHRTMHRTFSKPPAIPRPSLLLHSSSSKPPPPPPPPLPLTCRSLNQKTEDDTEWN